MGNTQPKTKRSFGPCAICLDVEAECHALCGDGCESGMCADCAKQYFEQLVAGGFDGAPPTMACPFHPKRVVSWSTVSKRYLTDGNQKVVRRRAAALLSLQCGNCHTRKDLMVTDPYPDNTTVPAHAAVATRVNGLLQREGVPPLPNKLAADLGAARAQYLEGRISDAALIDTLDGCLQAGGQPGLGHGQVQGVPAPAVLALLRSMDDPERRATAHVAYLRRWPKVWTKCCQAVHCFRCHCKPFHDGLTCAEYQASKATVEDVVPCPGCGLQLTKGDGCSSVKCVCGKAFTWTTELRKVHEQLAELYLLSHTDLSGEAELAHRAARIVFDPSTSAGEDVVRASAWGTIHQAPMETAQSGLWIEHSTASLNSSGLSLNDLLVLGCVKDVSLSTALRCEANKATPPREMDLAKAWLKQHDPQVKQAKSHRQQIQGQRWAALFGEQAPTFAQYWRNSPKQDWRNQCQAWSKLDGHAVQRDNAAAAQRKQRAVTWEFLHPSPVTDGSSMEDCAAQATLAVLEPFEDDLRSSLKVGDVHHRLAQGWRDERAPRLHAARAVRWEHVTAPRVFDTLWAQDEQRAEPKYCLEHPPAPACHSSPSSALAAEDGPADGGADVQLASPAVQLAILAQARVWRPQGSAKANLASWIEHSENELRVTTEQVRRWEKRHPDVVAACVSVETKELSLSSKLHQQEFSAWKKHVHQGPAGAELRAMIDAEKVRRFEQRHPDPALFAVKVVAEMRTCVLHAAWIRVPANAARVEAKKAQEWELFAEQRGVSPGHAALDAEFQLVKLQSVPSLCLAAWRRQPCAGDAIEAAKVERWAALAEKRGCTAASFAVAVEDDPDRHPSLEVGCWRAWTAVHADDVAAERENRRVRRVQAFARAFPSPTFAAAAVLRLVAEFDPEVSAADGKLKASAEEEAAGAADTSAAADSPTDFLEELRSLRRRKASELRSVRLRNVDADAVVEPHHGPDPDTGVRQASLLAAIRTSPMRLGGGHDSAVDPPPPDPRVTEALARARAWAAEHPTEMTLARLGSGEGPEAAASEGRGVASCEKLVALVLGEADAASAC